MRILEGKELEDAITYCGIAAKVAVHSNCRKSKNGTVLVQDGDIIGHGYNTPIPGNKECNPCLRENIHDNGRIELCHALHAEHVTVDRALELGIDDFRGSVMYHARLKKGIIALDNTPTCTHCSRLIRHKGIEGFVMKQGDNHVYYDAEKFDRESYIYVLNNQIKTF